LAKFAAAASTWGEAGTTVRGRAGTTFGLLVFGACGLAAGTGRAARIEGRCGATTVGAL
jgi:hypothetical protein